MVYRSTVVTITGKTKAISGLGVTLRKYKLSTDYRNRYVLLATMGFKLGGRSMDANHVRRFQLIENNTSRPSGKNQPTPLGFPARYCHLGIFAV